MNARGHKGFNAAVWGGRPPAQPKRMHGAAPLAHAGGLHPAAPNAAAARRPPRRPDALVSDHVAPENDDPSAQWARVAPAARPAVARRDRVAPVSGGPTAEDALHRMLADGKGSVRRGESPLPPQQHQQVQRGRPPPFDPRRQAPAPSSYDAGDVGDYGAYADEPPQQHGNAPQQQYGNAYGGRSQSPAVRPPYGNAQPPPHQQQQQPPYGGAYGAPPRWEPASAPQSARFGSNRSGYSPRPKPDSALFELYAMTMQSPREQGRSRLAAAKEVANAAPPVDQRRSFDQPGGSRADEWAPYPPQPRAGSARGGGQAYY
jgi:hypothetical protein